MHGLLLFLHLVGVVAWIGGMAFAVLCLHPALGVLAGKDRIALMTGTLGRFLRLVVVALVLIWASGAGLVMGSSMERLPLGWHMMIGIAFVMTLVFAYLYIALFHRVQRTMAAGDAAPVPGLLGRIRALVIVNLILGTGAIAAVTLVG
jgi:uncharacterized membrane protein